jgi:transposase
VQIVQPASLHASQKALLEKRLQLAQEQLEKLTRSGKGRRVWNDETELRQAIEDNYLQKEYEGLLGCELQKKQTTKTRYGKSGRPRQADQVRTEVEVRYRISTVRRNEELIEQWKERLGWRPMGTNAPRERLPLEASVETYREGAGMERAFHQMKDAPLGIRPLFVKREEQIKGLTRLLLVALRVMTLVEIVVRAGLEEKKEALGGLHEGQKNKMESRPTAKRLLSAIARLHLTLFQLEYEGQLVWQLLALPDLLLQVLGLLGLPVSLYLDLTLPMNRPPPVVAFDTPVPLIL